MNIAVVLIITGTLLIFIYYGSLSYLISKGDKYSYVVPIVVIMATALGFVAIFGMVSVVHSNITYEVVDKHEIIEVEGYEEAYIIQGKIYVSSDNKNSSSIIYEETNDNKIQYSLSYKDKDEVIKLNLTSDNVITIRKNDVVDPELTISTADTYDNKYLGIVSVNVPKHKQTKYGIVIPE